MARRLLGVALLGALVALAPLALADDEDAMGLAPPRPAEPAAVASSATTAAVATAAVSELPALTRDLDAIFADAWKKAGVTPAPDAAQGELARRVYLELAGRTPTSAEVKELGEQGLLAVVDRLLASPAYAENMAESLTVVLLGREVQLDGLTRRSFRDWLAARLEKDAPIDELARDLLAPRTDSVQRDPAAQYLALFGGDVANVAGRTARIFLGNRIACAQCHDHPYEPWKRTDFWSLAAYFSRLRREPIDEPLTDEMRKKKVQQRIVDWRVHEAQAGDTYIPLQPGETGRPALALPRFLGSTYDVTLHGTKEPRLPSLARAVSVEKRHELARAFANRLFAQLFGRGIVHPVDDFSEARTPTIPAALERLTEGFVAGGLRLKPFLRALALTEAYARTATGSPAPAEANVASQKVDARDREQWAKRAAAAEDPALELFARMRHKPLSPEQALRAFVSASRTDGNAKELTGIRNELVRLMQRNDEEDPHSVQEGIPLALVLMNGPSVNFFTRARPGSTVARAAKEADVAARIDELYAAAFSRGPSAAELAGALAFFDKKDATRATEDYFWSLLNSSEFLYNHLIFGGAHPPAPQSPPHD